jgi:hypothetical protein
MRVARIEESHLVRIHDRALAILVEHESAAARQYQHMAAGAFLAAASQRLRATMHILHADERTEMKLARMQAQWSSSQRRS